MKFSPGRAVFFLLTLVSAGPLFAQNIPPGSEAATQSERYKKETETQKQKLEQEKAKAPSIEIKKQPEQPSVPAGVSFLLKEVEITGATYFKPDDFRPLYEPYLNTAVTFGDLETIAKKIQAKYQALGFLTSSAYIPQQEISGGKVQIKVIEGKMGLLKVEGNKHFSSGLIASYIHVKKNEILNIKTLQRDLLRLNRNPDLEIASVIDAGQVPETSDIVLKVREKSPVHAGFGSDNQGTRLTGKYRGSVFALDSNLTGRFDSLYLNSSSSSLSLGESIGYTLPIGTYGATFGIDAIYFTEKIGKQYKPFDITGLSEICVPHMSWELYLSEDLQAYANAGIEIKSLTKKVGSTRAGDDQLRLPYFGFTVTKNDTWQGGGQTAFTPRFAFGTEHFLGASTRDHISASRANTGGFFFAYEQGITRLQRMPLDSYAQMRLQFQLASHSLPASEQLQLGGATTVRGYPEGDYSADRGGYFDIDWVFPMYPIPESWRLKGSTVPLRRQITPVLFIDTGGGSLKSVGAAEHRQKFLAGAGCGLRFNFPQASLSLDWATHVGDDPAGGAGPSTFYLTFQSEF